MTVPPPSTGASRRPKLVRMGTAELPQHVLIKDVSLRYPGAFLRTIALPVDQILEAPAPATGIHDAADGVDPLTTEEPGRRGRDRRRTQGTGGNRLNLGHMKNIMDMHVTGKPEANGDRVDYGVNLEGSDERG